MPWSLLGIVAIVCAVLCAVGFYKFVYFLSIGYGFAVAGGGIAILIMALINPPTAPMWVRKPPTMSLAVTVATMASSTTPLMRKRKTPSMRMTPM